MIECNPTSTHMKVGMKLSTYIDSRPLSQSLYQQLVHWQAGNEFFDMSKGPFDFGILYQRFVEFILEGYFDFDWDGSTDTRKPTIGYVFSFGLGVISWQSKLQPTISLSSIE